MNKRLLSLNTFSDENACSLCIYSVRLFHFFSHSLTLLSVCLQLCFALSMIGNPQIVLLDEPSSGMDPKSKQRMWWDDNIPQSFIDSDVFNTC